MLTSLKDERKYCGHRYPFSLKTIYYELEVKMKTLSYRPPDEDRGFVIGWVTYNDGEWLFRLLVINLTVHRCPMVSLLFYQ